MYISTIILESYPQFSARHVKVDSTSNQRRYPLRTHNADAIIYFSHVAPARGKRRAPIFNAVLKLLTTTNPLLPQRDTPGLPLNKKYEGCDLDINSGRDSTRTSRAEL